MNEVTVYWPTGIALVRVAFAAMVAILFLQSSLDKLFNWDGEKDYVTEHFARSPLRGFVPIMLPLLTILELMAGSCSAIGLCQVLVTGGTTMGALGMLLATSAVIALFFGQRVAKDYAGAASLVPYFLLCAGGMWVFTS